LKNSKEEIMKSYDDSILLINKDPDIMSTFSVILGEYGYNLSVALDKETAIEIVKQKKIDLIVIDFTYFDIEPSDLFDTIVEIKPEIPRIIMIAKEMFDESHIKKIYPYIYDIIVKPVVYIDDFRLRIKRGIENSKLLKENKEFQRIMIEKTFRSGMFDILSGILGNVNNHIDQLLADLYFWQEEYRKELNGEKILNKFDEYFNTIKNKILDIEETIQLNEVLLSEHKTENGIMINNVIEDILQTLNYTFKSSNISLDLNLEKVTITKIDSSKIIQCLFHLIDNSIYSLKHILNIDRELKIQCRNVTSKNKKKIEITIVDNGIVIYKDLESIFTKNFTPDTKSKVFELYSVKKYIDLIDGEIHITSPIENNLGTKISIKIPIV